MTDRTDTHQSVTAVDLFAGAGGLTLGLQQAGIKVVAGADSWAPACQSYAANFEHPIHQIDIGAGTVEEVLNVLGIGGPVDVVAGGPPCQGFSIQRIGSEADARNELIMRFAEVAIALSPKVIVMENVPGLLGKRGSRVADDYRRFLTEAGYCVEARRINAVEYSVPQSRRRVVFLAWRTGGPPIPAFTTSRTHVTVRDAIGDLPSPPLDLSPLPGDSLHRRTRLSPLNMRRLEHIPPGGGFEHLPIKLRVHCHRNGPARIGHRNVYGRLAPDEPAVTITARFDSFTRGKFAHPWEDRNITLREGARLQTFPDGHALLGTQEEVAALIGNAVPPKLGRAIGEAIRRHLCSEGIAATTRPPAPAETSPGE